MHTCVLTQDRAACTPANLSLEPEHGGLWLVGLLLPSVPLVWAQPGLQGGIKEVEVSLHVSPGIRSWTGNTGERSRRGGARKKLPWNPQEEAALPSGSKASCSLQGPPKGTKHFVFLSGGKMHLNQAY